MQLKFPRGLTPRRFLADFWHKKPLLIRNALPGFSGLIDPDALFALAARENVESRLVRGRMGGVWNLEHGPLAASRFKRLPKSDWTLLVQDLNHHLPAADRLLQLFRFIPYARLDDVMVSYAAPGGSVGPHFDSYDVFLLQGTGRRRWQISTQTDLTLLPDAPLRLLAHFEPEAEWVLEPGDMLYLPPHVAHHGVAEGACTTYSIGFRAPSANELVQAFLMHLQDTLTLEGRYADPDLALQRHPGEIGGAMLSQIGGMLAHIRWSAADIAEFTGRYLSEPKPSVFFDAPETPLSARSFARRAAAGVYLDPKTRLLFVKRRFFINGEGFDAPQGTAPVLRRLADTRRLEAVPAALMPLLHDWHDAGWLHLAPAPPP